ncbi:MAG: phosphoribosylaminoimidazolesuccinocarboxamide synthase, partial [Candidatus Diapherotrites archaeon]
MYEIKEAVLNINDFITEKANSLGLEHADGKVEFAITPKNEIMLVDVCGTLDENRFLWNNIHVSKQVCRDYYKKLDWYKQLEEAKAKKLEKGVWPVPPKLPEELVKIVSNMYASVCNEWIGEKRFKVPKLEEVMHEYVSFLEKSTQK